MPNARCCCISAGCSDSLWHRVVRRLGAGHYQAGAARHHPQARITFDPFHVVALASQALDQVRRAEAKVEPDLKGSRWALLKCAANWNRAQINTMHRLQRSGLSNALVEAMNAQIQAAKARAKGYATVRNLMAIAYLLCAKLKHLPRTPWLAPTMA